MLSPCLFTAPAWNSNETPRQRLADTSVALGTVLDSFLKTRQARRHPHPSLQPWGTPPTPPQAQARLDSPGCAEPQSRSARSPDLRSPRGARRRWPRAPGGGGGAVISPPPLPLEGSARVRPPARPPPSRSPVASARGRRPASHRVGVERRERGPRRRCGTGPGWVVRWRRRWRLPQQSRVRLQRQLQVQDVVDNVLQDLHFADFLVGRDGGHQPPQAAVAVVHIALQAQRRLVGRRLRRLAARCRRCRRRGRRATQAVAVLGQAAQSQLPTAAARRRLAARGAHRAHRLHRARPAPCASGPAGASEGGRQAPGPRPRPAPRPLPSRPARSVRARGTAKLPAIPRPRTDGRVAPGFARGISVPRATLGRDQKARIIKSGGRKAARRVPSSLPSELRLQPGRSRRRRHRRAPRPGGSPTASPTPKRACSTLSPRQPRSCIYGAARPGGGASTPAGSPREPSGAGLGARAGARRETARAEAPGGAGGRGAGQPERPGGRGGREWPANRADGATSGNDARANGKDTPCRQRCGSGF